MHWGQQTEPASASSCLKTRTSRRRRQSGQHGAARFSLTAAKAAQRGVPGTAQVLRELLDGADSEETTDHPVYVVDLAPSKPGSSAKPST